MAATVAHATPSLHAPSVDASAGSFGAHRGRSLGGGGGGGTGQNDNGNGENGGGSKEPVDLKSKKLQVGDFMRVRTLGTGTLLPLPQ